MIVRDLGIDYVQEVLKRMLAVYKGQDNLLKPIIKRTSGRPFQFYHLWRDERKKVAINNVSNIVSRPATENIRLLEL